MTERTIRVVPNCTADEAAALVAAIRAYEESSPGRRAPAPPAGAAAPRRGAGPPGDARSDGVSVLWTSSGRSRGRSF
jgi:hypothetical protein